MEWMLPLQRTLPPSTTGLLEVTESGRGEEEGKRGDQEELEHMKDKISYD